jgi:hypothetical protein
MVLRCILTIIKLSFLFKCGTFWLTLLQGPLKPIFINQVHTPVYALATSCHPSPCHLAVATGREVHLAAAVSDDGMVFILNPIAVDTVSAVHFTTLALLPLPDGLKGSDEQTCGRSLHFVENGQKLVISYLNHGIMFVSGLSPSHDD